VLSKVFKILRDHGPLMLAAKGVGKLIGTERMQSLLDRAEGRRLQSALRNLPSDLNKNDILDFCWSAQGRLIRPDQIREEISGLLDFVFGEKKEVRYVMEIGTHNGGTLFPFTRLSRPNACIISLDLPHADFGGGYEPWKRDLYQNFAVSGQTLHLLQADSHEQATCKSVQDLLGANQLDFLFIDGDHTYGGVKKDFEMYSPLVRAGGIVAFHDIIHGPSVPTSRVDQFWEHIKSRYPYREIINDAAQGGAGIGLITM
jgi:predicted O-methyltransferase YrrM